ncbi:hypothetical protein QBC37DRAFT_451737 [Rhypophila decipiens]|uniref:F-box domain-containing protein n=1 Tax=Rhypophila decipiens TaxID=261697 RepID=A0AAN6XY68_9PEZI|nr:hypothetical protein QBC37DRAFT_451737 [Rhypophila decipiens]
MSALQSNDRDDTSSNHQLAEFTNDKIIAKCTIKTRPEFDELIQPFPKEDLDLFKAQLRGRAAVTRSSALGDFQKIPTEIMTMVLLVMDVKSLIKFSHASSMTRALVQQVPEFRLVTKYAGTTAFLGVIATQLSIYHSIADLYTVLTTSQCSCCEDYAEMVFLPTLDRFCIYCLRSQNSDYPCTVLPHVKRTDVSQQVQYTFGIFPRSTSLTPAEESHLRSTLPWKLGNPPPIEKRYLPENTRWLYRSLPYYDWIFPQHLLSMVVPYLKNRKTGEVGPKAVQCRGCLDRRAYMPEIYLKEHFPTCYQARDLLLDHSVNSEEER